MYKLVRNFTITGIVCIVLGTALLGGLYREATLKSAIALSTGSYIAFSKLLVDKIWPKFEPLAKERQGLSNAELTSHSSFSDFKAAVVRMQSSAIEVLNVHVYALSGKIIFSTDAGQLGVSKRGVRSFDIASVGKEATETVHRDRINLPDGLKFDRNIMINYLPAYNSGNSQVKAVFEISFDITPFIYELDRKIRAAYWLIAGILSLLFGALLVVVKFADKYLHSYFAQIESQQKLIDRQRNHDSLTGLPNRTLFMDLLKQAMQTTMDQKRLLALLYIDLYGFDKVNDTLGCVVGDNMQRQVAQRLKQCVRKNDFIACLSGAEFVIVLESISSMDDAEDIFKKIIEVISESFQVDGNELFLTPSIGVSLYPFGDDSMSDLIKNAKVALRQAQKAGRNTYRLFCPGMSRQSKSQLSMESSLRKALEREEFELHYQPLMQLKTGKILGVEALVRWRSPELGLVPPLDFIPLLEDTGLILPVGQWILETACQQGVTWQQQGIHYLKININVSAIQFMNNGIINQVRSAIDVSGLKPQLIDLELTESLLINDTANCIKTLDKLNELGVALSIDDFGTGYSSLSYLKRIPIETLKIDKSFVQDITCDSDDVAIVDAICSLSRSLRLNVIAEGVETHEQLNYLRNFGVGMVQGYLLSRPLPASELTEILRIGTLAEFKESVA